MLLRTSSEPDPRGGGQFVGLSSFGNEAARLEQSLTDLHTCDAAEVSLVRCDLPDQERYLVERLAQRARRMGFVTAILSLGENSLDAFDAVVRELLEQLTSPVARAEPLGLMGLLAAHRARNGAAALSRFASAAARWGACDDLTAFCSSVLREHPCAPAAYQSWLEGVRAQHEGLSLRDALNERSARRALAELTRIVRALGHAGCLLCLTNGDSLTRLTQRQSERAYTVLRELIDNFDRGRGMVATRLMITGGPRLFDGPRSLHSLGPLASRLAAPSTAHPTPPHRSWTALHAGQRDRIDVRPTRLASPQRTALRTLIRIAQGLPPTDALTAISVGHEAIDQVITQLLEHARLEGSVFAVIQGEYGTGKTHLLLHLADRAVVRSHPVFRLNLERLNLDLGNPARHLYRLLDDSELPLPRRPSALEWLSASTRHAKRCAQLFAELGRIAEEASHAAEVARRALDVARAAPDPARTLEWFLSGLDLVHKLGRRENRREAYGRLLLWIELMQRLERWRGPVLLIDEAENLYAAGVSSSVRRTALRSLSFYCGGALPATCVVLSTTPRALGKLKYEAGELLADLATQSSVLEWEDAGMLRHRLVHLKPHRVPPLTHEARTLLAERVTATHQRVRGPAARVDLTSILSRDEPPRQMLRRLVDELESAWWRERTS